VWREEMAVMIMEIMNAILRIREGKAPRPDGIVSWIIKDIG